MRTVTEMAPVLELQRALSFDEQDRKLGMDILHLFGWWHPLWRCGKLVRNGAPLGLHFDEEAADHFEVDGVVVELDDSAPKSLHDDVKRAGQPRSFMRAV